MKAGARVVDFNWAPTTPAPRFLRRIASLRPDHDKYSIFVVEILLGEDEEAVAIEAINLSAGITDSALTNHGVLQANRLGSHLLANNFKVSHIFSSDLRRAVKTAEAIRDPQSPEPPHSKLEILREQDFGFYEGKQFFELPKEPNKTGKEAHQDAHRNEPGFKDVESKEAMKLRMETFVEQYLRTLLHEVNDEHTVVIVAHGIILNYLWKSVLVRFQPGRVSVTPGIQAADRGFSLEYLGGWSNTGYLDLEIRRDSAAMESLGVPDEVVVPPTPTVEELTAVASSPDSASAVATSPTVNVTASTSAVPVKLLDMSMVVKGVNCQDHLKGLKKTRGGIGSSKHDSSQKTMDSFFKKRRIG